MTSMASHVLLLAFCYDKCDASFILQLFSSSCVKHSVMFIRNVLLCYMVKNSVSMFSPLHVNTCE
jgi:hypothetical protein